MKKLKIDSESTISLHEAKTTLLTAFEKTFGKDFVYSPNMDFEFTNDTFSKVYALLNAHLFENRLKMKKLNIYRCTPTDVQMFIDKMHIANADDPEKLFAAYMPEVNKITGKLQRESILLMTSKEKMTFLFAVGELCHEMIHQYDANYGILLKIAKEDEKFGIDRSHDTPFFVKFMRMAAMEGIRVMINGNNTPFDILNQEAIQFTINLRENDNAHFFEMVKKLENGESVQNVCLTNRGTVAFFIP